MLYDFMMEYLAGNKNNLADALLWQYEEVSNVEVHIIKVEEQKESKLNQKLRWEAAKRDLEMLIVEKRTQLVQYQHSMGHFEVEACCQCIQRDGFWWPRMSNRSVLSMQDSM